tara:strand:- start:4030 stop:4233 length:204 start_codon:yes stop_codon:yes gene_type:complete
MSKRRKYSIEFKREAEDGSLPAFKGSGNPRDQEVTRLKRELARVTQERDFLKGAAVYFAKASSKGTR